MISQSLYRNSHVLAESVQGDSRTMKIIAVLTMCFLPGTFVSSLLSMPLFRWNNENSSLLGDAHFWRPRLSVFLTFALPLQFFTFLTWGIYERTKSKRDRIRQGYAAHVESISSTV